jgi:hypothetical protein
VCSRVLWRSAALALAAALAAASASAEELAAYGGTSHATDDLDSYAWQLEYRQRLARFAAASFSYLNEGHLGAHHRDGGALQLWAVMPRIGPQLELAFGAGAYLYFDTQIDDSATGYRDSHSIGEIYSASLSWYPRPQCFVRLNVNQVRAGNLDSRAYLIGAGYVLESFDRQLGSSGDSRVPPRDELGVFVGQTVSNTASSEKSTNFGIEYRRHSSRYLALSAGWLNESDGADGRHNGVLGEVWLVHYFGDGRLNVGLGAGPYVSLGSHDTADGRAAPTLVGVISMTAGWRLGRSALVRLSWHRSFTQDDQDRDVVTLGAAYLWGS